ncbi:ribonuclease Y [Candidatus Peregrinibacteria bacterium]|jgi:ribonucrease Y|nr:ribonuclease Y [Candidatus Peregrinibacteria bacterium]MBT4148528.1 ribonuclease Y [Candidatus Peregrinibacteria bacterium]MBT4455541.1 ribonuclease Y [Candidatus Peregrinibacteria bacterium]
MTLLTTVIIAVVGLAAGGYGGFLYRKQIVEEKKKDLAAKAEKILADAKGKANEVVYEAKNEAFKLQDESKKDEQRRREQLTKVEERLAKKEQSLDDKSENVEKLKGELEDKVTSVKKLREEVESIHKMQEVQLEKVAAMSKEEAREVLLKKVEEDAKQDIVFTIKKAEDQLKKEADGRAKFIIAEAVQRYAAETASESTATIVNLPNDDLKGRIIGREGRNINTFEQITGIDVIVDDTPGSIVISGFDLVRRYIAKIALERLIEDGRIHPARIEETVEKVKDEVNVLIKELGEKAVIECGVAGFHPNLVKILGRLKFRVTHGQNALKHSMEVCFIAANLAEELGADVSVCKRAALLHDLGKAVDHEIPGHHAKIGADIASKFGLPKEVIQAIQSHHGDPEPESVEAQIVYAANQISNARPGANKDNLDSYIRRLAELENVCSGFDGVEKTFAVQAGTEVRIFVTPKEIDDLESVKLSHALARKIEYDLQHPGPVKVNVIRETRAEAFAE